MRERVEPFFGHDFSQVRVHTGRAAAALARGVGARAITVGPDLVFGSRGPSPASVSGQELLSHELAHVVQQSVTGQRIVQRRMEIEDHTDPLSCDSSATVADEVAHQVTALSPRFRVSGDRIEPTGAAVCTAPSETRDQCLCDLHASATTWSVAVDENDWPHTEESAHRVVVQPRCSIMEFGAWGGGAQAGTRLAQSPERILGHELCGHAWLMDQGTHPPGEFEIEPGPGTRVRATFVEADNEFEEAGGTRHDPSSVRVIGRPSHDPTVRIENVVGREIAGASFEPRGEFSDPHHGESFARITVSPFPTGQARVSSLPRDQRRRIGRVAQVMNADSFLRADVLGHTDHEGTATDNARLSRQRALHVRERIVGRGVDRSRFLTVEGRSDTECPAAPPSDNPACRKAEVFIYKFEASSEGFVP